MMKLFNETSLSGLNAILKVSCFWILFLILLVLIASQSGAVFSPRVHQVVYALSIPVAALLVTWIMVKWERKSLSDFKLVWQKDTLVKFFKGLGIGVLSYSVIVFIIVLFADVEIIENPNGWTARTLCWYLLIIPLALMEEIAFRSYPFLKLNNAFGLRITQFIVAIVFAAYHVFMGWDAVSALLGPGIWAFVFGIAAIRSNGIAVPTGIHVGLNLTLTLFGRSGGGYKPIWIVKQEGLDSNIGLSLFTGLLVLAAGVVLTEFYIRRSRRTITEET